MGRPRKPDNIKILHGDRADRINRNAPSSPAGLGEPPDWFDDVARSAWARLAELLQGMGLGTRADSEAAAIYCQAYVLWRKALEAIGAEGLTIETESTTKPHPLLSVLNESSRQMMRILSQFGMTPSSRSGLHVQTTPEDDPVLAFFAKKAPKPEPNGGRQPDKAR